MNLSEIRDYVREYLDLDADDMSDTLLNRWANEGQRQVLNSRARWTHLEDTHTVVTELGTVGYDIGASLRTILAVDCASVGALGVVDEAEAKARYWTSGEAASGSPKAISRWGEGQVRVWPTPDGVYSIELLGMRPAVTMTATSEPDLPEDLHDAVLEWTMQKAYLHQDDLDAAAVHMKLFDRTLTVFADRDADGEDTDPIIFGGGFGSNTRSHARREAHWTPTFGDLGGEA